MHLIKTILFFPFMNPFIGGNFNFIIAMQSVITLFIIGFIAFAGIKALIQWKNNNDSPVVTIPVTIVSKRIDERRREQHRTTTYFVTFEDQNKDRIELRLSGSEYGMLAEDDIGELTFQGTRYLSFERNTQV